MNVKLQELFEGWRDDAVNASTPWMKAADVIRSMKKTLEKCEREMRGEIKPCEDGKNVVIDGVQGELYLKQPANHSCVLTGTTRQGFR